MSKLWISLGLIFGLISCTSSTKSIDYLGQSYPDMIPLIFAPDIVSVKGRLDHGISFTPDTQEVAFGVLDKEDFSGDIWYAKKESEGWTRPAIFEPLKGQSVYLPYFSPDGQSMLFAKSVSDTNKYVTDIWRLQKNKGTWSDPKKEGHPISSLEREASACMSLDKTIYFSSNRDSNSSGTADLYVSSLENGTYTNAKRIDVISSERDEESIFVAPDEDYIIFSRYATNENAPDLWISYQDATKKWTQPRSLDATINTSDWERRPFVSADHNFLFFTRLQMDEKGLAESDIYWVHTKKVFKPFVFNPITTQTIKVGKETTVSIPTDYFKDIDQEQLEISFNNENVKWASFDSSTMILTMHPDEVGEFEVIFSTVDAFSNETNDRVKIIVAE
ncbi:hypothetical protein [Aquimarina rubra]|uniref:WD40 repeat protein n=1 Tax=Aquimarina rubra TaxID=1920033 RepID=A0ABW5LLB1_9FLAO